MRRRRGCASPRIIPAHAGQTKKAHGTCWTSSDHPRACGANRSGSREHFRGDGSSPRMRGKRGMIRQGGLYFRIIPAHAGQTSAALRQRHTRTDHPRACGANGADKRVGVGYLGSSPRMRGKLTIGLHLQADARIIPAHAGQTDGRYSIPLRCSDHPRACGANTALESLGDDLGGSSPRMRGKLHNLLSHFLSSRIIPAHAGQTPWRPGIRCPLRIIPAHAGQTSASVSCAVLSADHPRACGANVATELDETSGSGSSPRMRGKLSLGSWSS